MNENLTPIYRDEHDNLYTYEEKTGCLWHLKPGDFAGEAGKPLPGTIEGKGKMTCIGMYRLSD